jgi:putative cardiolipin synthase
MSTRLPLPDWIALKRIARLLIATAAVLLSACASLPAGIDRQAIASAALPLSAATQLGQIAIKSLPATEMSGFRLMPLGSYSLDTRLELARRAQQSLDVQYYHIQNDETGLYLLRMLRDAAQRGVRVRLLMDDLYTTGEDELLMGLAAYPNVQIRLFNPFVVNRELGQTGRFLTAVGDWSRINHRMHNKLFIADGAMAILGGRNVANEYYLRGAEENFVDLDVFAIGNIVPDLAAIFDRYWNSEAVFPLQSITASSQSVQQLRDAFELATGPDFAPPPAKLPPNDVLGYGPISEDLVDGQLGLIFGAAFALADDPSKVMNTSSVLSRSGVTYNVLAKAKRAEHEIVVSSPYLIPGKVGIAYLQEIRNRGIKVQVMTNSLASTDEPIVHTGYSRYREAMVRMGVDLYELSSSRLKHNKRQSMLFGTSQGRLHAKLVVIDKKSMFIGSMNLDPRSASVNTEMGVIIESPQLARELLRVIDIDRLQSAYRVQLAPNGSGLQWISADENGEMVLTSEPDSSFLMRLQSWLLSPLVPEELL